MTHPPLAYTTRFLAAVDMVERRICEIMGVRRYSTVETWQTAMEEYLSSFHFGRLWRQTLLRAGFMRCEFVNMYPDYVVPFLIGVDGAQRLRFVHIDRRALWAQWRPSFWMPTETSAH